MTPSSSSRTVAMLGVAPVLLMANPKSGPATLRDLPKAAAAPGYVFWQQAGRAASATSSVR